MITLLPRKELLEIKKIVGSEIAEIQKAIFDEEMLKIYNETNEGQQYFEGFDFLEGEMKTYKTHSKVISLGHSNIKTFTRVLTLKLKELFQAIGASEFYILSHLRVTFSGIEITCIHLWQRYIKSLRR